MVHGEQATSQAKAAAAVLFGRGDVRELDGPTRQAVARELPGATVAPTTVLIDAFIDAGITASKGAARRDADGGGLSVNGEKISADALQSEVGDLDPRSEEHTSELQSRFEAVCRLL